MILKSATPLIILVSTWLVAGCASISTDMQARPVQVAISPAQSGIIARTAARFADAAHPDQSGFHLLDANADALNWRLALIDSAESSLDLMYYLWYGDEAGQLLLKHVIRAAERGVEVRLLVDDLILIGDDKGLVALDRHPHIQLAIFNPKRQRKLGRALEFIGRFGELNTRMHNKLVVADNHAAIIGGRNIGNHYFGLDEKYNFADLDVIGFGPVAQQSSELFDHFWNSDWTVPAAQLPARVTADEAREEFEKLRNQLKSSEVLVGFPVEPRDWSAEIGELTPKLRPGSSEVVFDHFIDGELQQAMRDPLGEAMDAAEKRIDIVNAYIIPGQNFIDGAASLSNRGVDITILTNSLESHDVPAVNSHYKKWRKPLLDAGVRLFEFRADPEIKKQVDTPPVVSGFSGLHSKAFVVDGRTVFIGSMNFDPRSADINSEMGVLIDSPGLGQDAQELISRYTAPQNAWQVTQSPDGVLTWISDEASVTRQPARSSWQRVLDALFRLLPTSQL